MKNALKFIAGLGLAAGLLSSCTGTYYVAERPVPPRYVRPVAPYAGAVWVPGEWAYRGGSYVYANGYWTRPRPNRVYVEGYWESGPRGHIWHRGYWQ